ncbi:hypothetical protein [Halocatena pleomorpha]|uniref:Uncharacterized protein n=1 Tax=Halocatena pleomorpha TaxID=1785090 RepID=A0A3P3R3W6_9EURY|nr:hypothetical protein [Halocatena pleomorpha]RRJ28024.1 hypothetical protein EIK79_16705 [Halocatena pleomorpha]
MATVPDDPITGLEKRTRACIATTTNRPPSAIESTDIQLVVLAADRLERGIDTDIGVISNDIAAGTCFDSVLTDAGYERSEYIDAKQFLTRRRDWDTQSNA